MAFVTELARAADCDRVSLGLVRGRRIILEAISHSAEVGDKMNLTGAIVQAMDEALLQRRELVYPVPGETEILINRNHEHLSRLQNQAVVASFPLFLQDRYYAVLTCERPADHPFSSHDLDLVRAVAALTSSALVAKEHNDRPLWRILKDAAATQITRLTGPGYTGRKLALLLAGLAILFFSLATGDYRLAADTTLEGSVRRAVVAPFDGYIDQAPARAGDLVAKDALLCTLDDRDLRLERLARFSQKSQLQRQHQSAVAKYDRAQAIIIEAQLDQATAELELIEARLHRTQLLAPFAGLLVSGDLSQRLGSAVTKGEVLFEVTPLDAYRVILEVDERRIGDVRPGQPGHLVLASHPGKTYAFTVTKITPITTAEEGRNFFRVEAQLTTVDDSLRPGMEGVGKVFVDRRRLIAIWTRELIEWLDLWLWRWLP
jgi:multidrug resistance efflux pump